MAAKCRIINVIVFMDEIIPTFYFSAVTKSFESASCIHVWKSCINYSYRHPCSSKASNVKCTDIHLIDLSQSISVVESCQSISSGYFFIKFLELFNFLFSFSAVWISDKTFHMVHVALLGQSLDLSRSRIHSNTIQPF
ncbi:hypothetical protein D3C72_1783880 [compost metagenome]